MEGRTDIETSLFLLQSPFSQCCFLFSGERKKESEGRDSGGGKKAQLVYNFALPLSPIPGSPPTF